MREKVLLPKHRKQIKLEKDQGGGKDDTVIKGVKNQ